MICPLEHERRAIARAIGDRATLVVSGPGASAVGSAVEQAVRDGAGLVVLAGLAGGLRATSVCPAIAWIADRDGRRWTPTHIAPGQGVGVLGIDEPAFTTARKAQLATAYGASLVDCESHAFASAASRARLSWCVVRGVSDGPGHALPVSATDWVTTDGRTRTGRVLMSLLLSPAAIPAVIGLLRRSGPALREVAQVCVELIGRHEALGSAPGAGSAAGSRAGAVPANASPIETQLGRPASKLTKTRDRKGSA